MKIRHRCYYGASINGVAPLATVISVKVPGQAGWGRSSVIARGIVDVADLKSWALRWGSI